MRTKEEFEFIMDQLLEEAVKSFKSTRQYALLQEKMEQMEQDCEAMFQTDEKAFALCRKEWYNNRKSKRYMPCSCRKTLLCF